MGTEPESLRRLALSVGDAAQVIGVSERTVWRLIADKELPVVKISRRTLIHIAALDGWLAAKSALARDNSHR